MGSIVNSIEKRITKQVSGTASKMLDKLKDKNPGANISTVSFPSNLENQAQSTYMVIYVLENEQNNQTFSTNVFDSPIDEDSYEIGAITWLNNTKKSLMKKGEEHVLNPIMNNIKEGAIAVRDWFTKAAKSESKSDDAKTVTIEKASAVREFFDDYIIPKRKQSQSKNVQDALDPTKNWDRGYKLVKAIQIQMPSSELTYKYENGWESVDTSTLNTIRSLLSGIGNMFGDHNDREKGKAQLQGVWDRMYNSIMDTMTGGEYTKDKQASSNWVYNPVLVFNYTVPTPRTFNYSFALYPRNKQELYDLFNIIQMLKFYALPEVRTANEKSTKALTFRYPAKFAIKFYTNGYENKWFPKTLTLGLTSIEETLTGDNGDMAYFENYFDKYSGNPPRMVKLRLSFKELGIMDREAANEGY